MVHITILFLIFSIVYLFIYFKKKYSFDHYMIFCVIQLSKVWWIPDTLLSCSGHGLQNGRILSDKTLFFWVRAWKWLNYTEEYGTFGLQSPPLNLYDFKLLVTQMGCVYVTYSRLTDSNFCPILTSASDGFIIISRLQLQLFVIKPSNAFQNGSFWPK